jgi:hypothetical protein
MTLVREEVKEEVREAGCKDAVRRSTPISISL